MRGNSTRNSEFAQSDLTLSPVMMRRVHRRHTESRFPSADWDLGPTFGQAVSRFAYTTPQSLRVSFGVRF
jgi:hypothetical protein